MIVRTTLVALVLTTAVACGDDDPKPNDTTDATSPTDATTATDATSTTDATSPTDATTATDTTTTDTTVADTDAGEVVDNPWGFPMRLPVMHTLPCEEAPIPEPDLEVLDTDWICTFVHGAVTGHVYAQSTPTACEVTFAGQPVYGPGAGWLAREGQPLAALSGVLYDWGGNHHNDSLALTWDGKTYTFYHSSFGWGWRKCQEMDCLQVRDAEGTLIEDGCTKDRTLPAVCRQVEADGTWAELIDTFAPCAGDPNYQ